MASIGYLVAKSCQGRGFATEGLSADFDFLRDQFAVRDIKAWVDTRNQPSIRLAQRLGMTQVEIVKEADFSKVRAAMSLFFQEVGKLAGNHSQLPQ